MSKNTMSKLTTMSQCIDLALDCKRTTELDCDIRIMVSGVCHRAYTVAVGPRELSFYCQDIVASYDINTICGRTSAILVDWSFE